MHADAAGLQVGVERVATLTEIEDDGVSIGGNWRDVGWIFAGRLFGRAVGDGCDDSICNGESGLTKDGVALELFARAGVDGAARVQLFPIHGVSLCDPGASVDGHGGAGVADCIAAGVGGDVSLSAKWRTDHGNGLLVDDGGCSAFAHVLLAGRSCACLDVDVVQELVRNGSARERVTLRKRSAWVLFGSVGVDWRRPAGCRRCATAAASRV